MTGVQTCALPIYFDPKAFVYIAAHRMVARKEDLKLDIRFPGDPPQKRRLVLDGMADEVGQAEWSSPCEHAHLSAKYRAAKR